MYVLTCYEHPNTSTTFLLQEAYHIRNKVVMHTLYLIRVGLMELTRSGILARRLNFERATVIAVGQVNVCRMLTRHAL